jgi:hypothetical protein
MPEDGILHIYRRENPQIVHVVHKIEVRQNEQKPFHNIVPHSGKLLPLLVYGN